MSTSGRRARVPQLDLAPLRIPAFRRFLIEDTVGGTALWTIQIGLTWTLLRTTQSGAIASFVQTMILLPIPIATLVGGDLADRLGPRPVMVISWLAMASAAGMLAILAESGLPVAAALLLSAVLGFFNGLYVVPAQVYASRSVPADRLAAAVGLTAFPIGLSRVIGGPLGGFILASLGPSNTLATGGLICLFAAALAWTLPHVGGDAVYRQRWTGPLEGLAEVRRSPNLTAVVLLGCIAAAFVYCYLAVMPVVVRDVVRGGAEDLGILTAAGGVGAIVAALVMNPVGRSVGRGRLSVVTVMLGGAAIVGLGLIPALGGSVVVAAVLSACTVTFTAANVLLLQVSAPPAARGRVLGVYSSVFYAVLPVSEALAGILSDRVGVTLTLAAAGTVAIASTAGLVRRYPQLLVLDVDEAGRAVA